ncbi:AAA family ATPase [Phytoactinopolyspora mesophila]|uniref:ATP-binding protein n=1 Tax=Phytoactinopolyspora mesophila TaxID=2650750 RepID=A0A7K3M5K2_9ACTN|nr:ATP-binding protein [Phytoactinopolyspora mesophila]NDL58601.1 ATP-binding protein [Phytoactinopolyspora mesophila]
MVAKPQELFARDREWRELDEFAASSQVGAALGLVYGRRRQGKTMLLELLARATDGLLFAATQQTERQNLADLGAAYAAYLGLRQPITFNSWPEALQEIVRVGESGPKTVIIDEFPYLVATTPALPSYVQQVLSPMGFAKQQTKTRMILCGSALTTMTQLLGSGAPLRGRASLELVVRPFSYREAAEFWNAGHDSELAFQLHALVGGTPAYLEMCGGSGPDTSDALADWVRHRLLNPASAMFREGWFVLREEPSISDPTSYSATLAALSAGNHRRSEIAAALGRPATAINHLLSGLKDVGLVEQVDDALREKRSVYRIAEPVVRFHQLLVRRHEPQLIAGRAARVWDQSSDTVASKIYGPHFEDLARRWCFDHADPSSLGGLASRVQPTALSCREHQRGHELDIVVTDSQAFGSDRVTAIGEAKYRQRPVEMPQLQRLDHLRGLLPSSKVAELPRLLLFSRSGFSDELRNEASKRTDVELIDLERLYHGA